jgi:hypothetical protein
MEQNRFLIIFRKYPYIAGGVIASLCLLGLIVRVSQNIPKKKLALEDLEKKIRHYEVNLNAASGIDADSLALKAIIEGIDPLLISPKDTTKLFSFFLDLERRTQVKMENPVLLEIVPTLLTPEKAALKTDSFEKTVLLKYQINLQGHLNSILSYMQEMNLMKKEDTQDCYSRITEVHLSRNPQDASGDGLNAQMLLTILGKQN